MTDDRSTVANRIKKRAQDNIVARKGYMTPRDELTIDAIVDGVADEFVSLGLVAPDPVDLTGVVT